MLMLCVLPSRMYGDRSNCSDWCKEKGNLGYQYRFLPNQKPLSDRNFYEELQKILKVQADQAEQWFYASE